MLGKLNDIQIEELLKSQLVGRISCYDSKQCYVVPVSYAYDGKYIYVRSGEGRKIQTMRTNPEVCFEIDDVKDMANWKSVIGWGTFEELTNNDERASALRILLSRHLPAASSETTELGPAWPFPPEDYKSISGIVFRIYLKEKTGRYETHTASPALA